MKIWIWVLQLVKTHVTHLYCPPAGHRHPRKDLASGIVSVAARSVPQVFWCKSVFLFSVNWSVLIDFFGQPWVGVVMWGLHRVLCCSFHMQQTLQTALRSAIGNVGSTSAEFISNKQDNSCYASLQNWVHIHIWGAHLYLSSLAQIDLLVSGKK